MPESIRHALVRTSCPQEHQEEIMADPSNRHCLIQIYLGLRKDRTGHSRLRAFRLQNLPLHVNQIAGWA
jgi:hypothetical protein